MDLQDRLRQPEPGQHHHHEGPSNTPPFALAPPGLLVGPCRLPRSKALYDKVRRATGPDAGRAWWAADGAWSACGEWTPLWSALPCGSAPPRSGTTPLQTEVVAHARTHALGAGGVPIPPKKTMRRNKRHGAPRETPGIWWHAPSPVDFLAGLAG
jgi:hypothetical protein